MKTTGFYSGFKDVWMIDGLRTPMIDYCGPMGGVSPTDMGIKVAKEVIKRSCVNINDIDSVVTGNMAPGDYDQFFLPRHIGLYAGVRQEVPALMAQRI